MSPDDHGRCWLCWMADHMVISYLILLALTGALTVGLTVLAMSLLTGS